MVGRSRNAAEDLAHVLATQNEPSHPWWGSSRALALVLDPSGPVPAQPSEVWRVVPGGIGTGLQTACPHDHGEVLHTVGPGGIAGENFGQCLRTRSDRSAWVASRAPVLVLGPFGSARARRSTSQGFRRGGNAVGDSDPPPTTSSCPSEVALPWRNLDRHSHVLRHDHSTGMSHPVDPRGELSSGRPHGRPSDVLPADGQRGVPASPGESTWPCHNPFGRKRDFGPDAMASGPKSKKSRRRPTLPGGLPPSTIGAGGLNCRVRNGNGCFPAAMATGNHALPQ